MAKLGVLILVAVVAVWISVLNEPLPEEFPGWWLTKLYLALWKAAFLLRSLGGKLGLDETAILQLCVSTIVKVFPLHWTENVTHTDTAFTEIPVRIYRPPVEELTGRGLLFYHGGGWVMGPIELFDEQLTRLAKELGAVVVFVHYRQAPDHPFPAAVEDCISAYKHFVDSAKAFKVDPARIAVMGDSAGGNLAAAVSVHALRTGYTPPPKLQVLLYPVLQGSNLQTPSYQANRDGPFLSSAAMAYFIAAYIFGADYKQYVETVLRNGHTSPEEKRRNAKHEMTLDALPEDQIMVQYRERLDFGNSTLWEKVQHKFRDPLFAPLFARNLSGVTPAYINTCQYDVLRDEGFYYAKRLREAKVKVKHDNIICFHAWVLLASYIREYDEQYKEITDFMKNNM